MEKPESELLKRCAVELNIDIDKKIIYKFSVFMDELLEWNKVINLTRITDRNEIIIKHFIDSLTLLKYSEINTGSKIIDVGSGAGFPGIPLIIQRPDLEITFLDSLNKRLNFIKNVSDKIDSNNISIAHYRAEEAGKMAKYREIYDFACARAVSELRILSEYCLPFVKVGGSFAAMKGPDSGEEIKNAQNVLKELGGEIESVNTFKLPMSDIERSIINIIKIKATPLKYPRHSVKINKKII